MAAAIEKWLIAELGRVPYRSAYRLQTQLAEERSSGKLPQNVVLLLEHLPVFTTGKRGGRQNLIVDPARLEEKQIEVVPIERGGDITYHGPGQLVCYLIVDIAVRGNDIRAFVRSLEEIMIRTAADNGIPADRNPQNRGAWIGHRKLGSIGIAIRRGITLHGFALNIDLDLTPFDWIHPCGLKDVRATSFAELTAQRFDRKQIQSAVKRHTETVFGISLEPVPPGRFHLDGASD